MNWKEEFDKKFIDAIPLSIKDRMYIHKFISTQFEKLVSEIPEILNGNRNSIRFERLQELKERWL
jgi:hypothetical protein